MITLTNDILAERRIGFAAALGCNANSVAEYVLTALLTTAHQRGISLTGKTIGVIGVGRIGSLVVDKVRALGMEPILNDPPLARETGNPHYQPITEALQADVVTLHVPLTVDGPDPTLHLIGEKELSRMAPSAVLINAARGEVVDTNALLQALTRRTIGGAVLDVWEGEPSIRWELFSQALIGTPHIAGHSYDGEGQGNGDDVSNLLPLLGALNRPGLRRQRFHQRPISHRRGRPNLNFTRPTKICKPLPMT